MGEMLVTVIVSLPFTRHESRTR